MRIFSAALLHETLSPDQHPTEKEHFEKIYLAHGSHHDLNNSWLWPVACWRELCQ